MKRHQTPASFKATVTTATAVAALICMGGSAAALTAADTVIQNQAVATYQDAGGNNYTAQSNLAEVMVRQVYAADISRNQLKPGAAGQPVYATHVLTNTGNGEDTYTISVGQMTNGASGDDAEFNRIRVYVDSNGNGVPDAGETMIADSTSVTGTVTLDPNVAADKSVNLVIEGLLPNAAAGTQVGAVLTATPTNGRVEDASDAIQNDGATNVTDDDSTTPGTNHLLVTITNDAVIDITKNAVMDEANQTITYTVTAVNNGGKVATGVVLYDQLPVVWYDKNGDGDVDTAAQHPDYPDADVDAAINAAAEELIRLPLVGAPFSAGLVDAADAPAASGDFDEVAAGYGQDLNGDGSAGTAPWSVVAIDDSLAPGTSISMTFTVSYDPALMEALVDNADVPDNPAGDNFYADAGSEIQNTAYAIGDLDGNPSTTPTEVITSNPTSEQMPPVYAVAADDTAGDGGGAADPTNDGKDDDQVDDTTQTVGSAAEGETVLFTVPITNNGNVTDPMELVDPADLGHTFPAGTVFQYWNANNNTQLQDTDSDGVINTPPLEPGETYNVVVRAILPTNSNGTGPFNATVAAYPSGAEDLDTASTAETGNTQSNVTLALNEIRDGGVDLSNSASTGAATDQDDYTSGGTTPTTTLTGNPGDTVDFNLWVQNDGGNSDAFQLYAGGGWDGGAALSTLPAGWSVQFFEDADDDGVADGGAITTTRSLIGGASLKIIARVRIAVDPLNALQSHSADINGDTVADMVDGNSDSDGDYAILFMARSVTTGAYDVKLDAVDVNAVEDYTVLADQSNQIAPGGSTSTEHTVENTGNTDKVFTPSVDNGDPNWTETIRVDTDGDGQPDATYDTLVVGTTTVYIEDPLAGLVPVTVVDNNGQPGVPLTPGQVLPLDITVFAPTSAPNGAVVNTVLTVTDDKNTPQTNNITNTVVVGKLRLVKTASVDADCGNAGTDTLGPDVTFTESGHLASPDDCVVWQVVATNTGVDLVEQVVILDTVPVFTRYEAGTMRYCVGDALTDAEDDAAENDCTFLDAGAAGVGAVNGDDLSFSFAGVTALGDTAGSPAGADLNAGASITIRFATRVE